MLYFLYKAGRFVALNLPLKISYWIADILGSLYYFLATKDRKIVQGNIRVILNWSNNAGRFRYVSRMVFVNFARYLVEFFRTPKVDLKYIKKYIRIYGRENLDKALESGRGVLVLSAHLGNWELGAIFLSMLGYKLNAVAWTHKNKQVNNFFAQQRQSKGVTAIPLGVAIRKVFSALGRNEIVAVLGDVDYTNPDVGVKVKLFGQDTILPKGPAVFSLKAACPIVPGYMFRKKDNTFNFVLGEPIAYEPSKNWENDVVNLTGKVAQAMQDYIVQSPEQWFMLSPRWKNNL